MSKMRVGQPCGFIGNMLVKVLVLVGTLCTFTYANKHSLDKNKTVISTTEMTEVTGSTTEISVVTTELLNTTFAICDDNCTELNNVTTESSWANKNESQMNKTETVENKPGHKVDTNICTCNLQVHYCDINCCCDPDCSTTNKQIFKYCEIDENRFVDDRYCNYIKHIYVNNTPFEWEVNQEGLFCVISRNLPKSHLVQNEKPINSVDAFKAAKSFWTYPADKHLDDFPLGSKNYAFGDPLIVVKNDSSTDILRIPKNLITRPCVFKEGVVYLKNDKSACSRNVIDENSAELSFSSFFQDFKVVANPRAVNLTNTTENFYQNCPKNVCMEVAPKLCDSSLSNCIVVKNITNIKFSCSFDIRHNLNRCQNGVRKIHYKLYHNGTTGLYKIDVLGVLSNFSYHFGKDNYFQFDQHFSVEFLWINQTKNYSEILSGNPGYVAGKPILMATKISNGNTTFIQRSSHKLIDNFLTFPYNFGGKCCKNATYNIPLEFGYNLLTKCLLQKQISFNISENATCMCRKIQEIVFDQWGIPGEANRSVVFGLFGNAVPHMEKDWANVLYIVEPSTVLNQTQGNLTGKNTTLICHNISTQLDVKISYSRVDFDTVLNQHKILGISYGFGNVRSHSYYLERKNNSISVRMSFELVSQVSFIDITSRKERVFVDPPSLEIRLPYDFFYPFVRLGNGTNLSAVPSNCVLFIVIILLLSILN